MSVALIGPEFRRLRRFDVYAEGGESTRPFPAREVTENRAMDSGSLTELYQQYAPAIFVHCRRLLQSPAAARDAVQETFVRMLVKGPSALRGEDALRYLYRISTNVCLNHLREQKVRERAVPSLLAGKGEGVSAEGGHADRQFALAIMERTDETGAAIAVLHYVDGLNQVEVAQILGITRRTVFNRLRRLSEIATDLLAERVSRSGGGPA